MTYITIPQDGGGERSMDCTHANIRELRTTGFTGPVNVRDENRAAHGNVCVSEECCACGSRRDRLVNGRHEEIGDWGPTRADREAAARAAERVVDALIAKRPGKIAMTHASGDRAEVRIDREGYLLIDAPGAQPSGDQIAAASPALVEYARELRLAAIEAARLRAEV